MDTWLQTCSLHKCEKVDFCRFSPPGLTEQHPPQKASTPPRTGLSFSVCKRWAGRSFSTFSFWLLHEDASLMRAWELSQFSPVWFSVTLCTTARRAPLSMGFSSQECWSGLPFPLPGDPPNPGIKSPALAGGFFTTSITWEAPSLCVCVYIYMYVCMYTFVCVYICVYVCASVYVRMCVYMCVCMYIYVCVYVCMYVCVHIYVCVYICLSVCIYMYACVYSMCVYMYVCVCAYVCVCMCVCIYVCVYMCVCVYMYVCVCVCMYISCMNSFS